MEHIGSGFATFMKESGITKEYMGFIQALGSASALEHKTHALAYISVLAAAGMTGGLDFHVRDAKTHGASRDEVKSAVLVGLPAVGLIALDALPIALDVYDRSTQEA